MPKPLRSTRVAPLRIPVSDLCNKFRHDILCALWCPRLGWCVSIFPAKAKEIARSLHKTCMRAHMQAFYWYKSKAFRIHLSVRVGATNSAATIWSFRSLCSQSVWPRTLVLLSRKQTQLSCCCSAPATCMIAVLCVVPGKQCNEIYRVLQINQQLQSTGHPEF